MRPRRDAPGGWDARDDEGRALDRRILKGSGWIALSYGGRNALSLVSMLVLVRLVEPSAFGLVALAWTFLMVVNQVQGAGVSSALIFHRDHVEERAATAAAIVIVSSACLFGVAFAVAPFVADLFHADGLTNVVRALAGVALLNALAMVPGALLEREVSFNLRARAELAGAVTQLGVSVGTAFIGWDVWALVAGQLAGAGVQAVGNWLLVPGRPDPRRASWSHVRPLVRYGRFVTGARLVNMVNNTVDNAVVGRLLGTGSLGFYAISFRLADFPNTVIGYIVGRVMFPVYSMVQGNLPEFRRMYVQNLQRVALLALPVSVTLAVAAEPIVVGVLGEDWRPAVEPLRILAVYGLIKSLSAPAGEVFNGLGRPSVNFAFGIAYTAVVLPALVVLVPRFELAGAASAMLAATAVVGLGKLGLALRAVELPVQRLVAALAPSLVCSAVLGAALALLLLPADALSPLVALVVVVAGGAAVYMAATALFARSIVTPVWLSLRGTR